MIFISDMNGMVRHHPQGPHPPMNPDFDKKRRNYKLLSDPMLDHSREKVYRFDGVNAHVRTLRQICIFLF